MMKMMKMMMMSSLVSKKPLSTESLISLIVVVVVALTVGDSLAFTQLERRDGLLECKELGQKCNTLFRCCGRTHCYWQNGFTLRKSGVCVKCVQKSHKCQRDVQCCDPLICQKSNAYHTDGTCDAKYPPGAECHDGDQCLSNRCKISYLQDVLGYGGKCA